ncbi:MAG: sigma-70 family RNA polymerase sigma factor [bacterium]
MHYSDEILVKRTLSGDKQAFDSLVVRYNKEIYKLILSWTKDPEDAQELTQEAFVTAYKELYSLHQPKKFYPWLRQMSIHLCQNWKRKNNIVYLPLDENMLSEEPSPEEALILKETLTKTMEAIDKLPTLDRDLIKKRYLEDTSYKELQRKYNISSKALSLRLHRARQKIKEWMEGLFVNLHWLRLIKLGVVESMKISLAKKLIIIGISIILVGGGTTSIVWYHSRSMKASSEATVDRTTKQSLPNSTERASGVSTSKDKSVSQYVNNVKGGKITNEEARQAIEWLDSLKSKTEQISINKGMDKEMSPEMKKKAELYAELAKILPEFKRARNKGHELLQSAQYLPTDERIKAVEEATKLLEGSGDLLLEIINLCGPILRPPAVERDERGVPQKINVIDICAQLAEYFGKKLPFDGNPDYLSAENYSGSTGWE